MENNPTQPIPGEVELFIDGVKVSNISNITYKETLLSEKLQLLAQVQKSFRSSLTITAEELEKLSRLLGRYIPRRKYPKNYWRTWSGWDRGRKRNNKRKSSSRSKEKRKK